jgi:hypothetical protein
MEAGWKWSIYSVKSDGQNVEHLTATGIRGEGAVFEDTIETEILPAIQDANISLPVGIVTYYLKKPAPLDTMITLPGVAIQRVKPVNKELTGYIDETGRFFRVENGLIVRSWDAD